MTKLCYVFSGQGPQWWAMGRQLYESEPVFCQWIKRIDAELAIVNNGEWRLLDELIATKNENESRMNDTNIAQPALFAIQIALAALLASWHVFPSAIVSHSAGEQAAAFVAGRVTLQEAVRIVYHRSRLQHLNTRQGGRMLAVSMSEQEANEMLIKDIEHLACVAVVNSPRSVTLSGDDKIIDEIQQILTKFHPNVFKARLRIENAFHSHQMDRFNIRKEILSSLSDIPGLPLSDTEQMFDKRCAQARLYSSVTGGEMDVRTPADAHYWWSNIRQCVRFGDAIATIVRDEAAHTFLELSPHPVLATSIRECCESTTFQPFILPTLKRKEDEQMTLLTSLAQLTTSPVVWKQYFKSRNVIPIADNEELFDTFPLYTFHTTPCWYESKESVMERLAKRIPTHPLLGIRQWTQHTSPTWKSLINLNLRDHAYLKDHKIQDAILFPAVGFIELALAACSQLFSPKGNNQPAIVFERIEFVKALVLSEHELTEVYTQVVMPMKEWFVYSRPWSAAGPDCTRLSGMSGTDVIDSFNDLEILNQYSLREFTLHAKGRITLDSVQQQQYLSLFTNDMDVPEIWSEEDSDRAYNHLSTRGYQYGHDFQLMRTFRGTTTTFKGQINSSIISEEDSSSYYLHPTVLDACCHPALALLPGNGTTFLPVAIRKLTIVQDAKTMIHSTVRIRGAYHDDICGISKQRSFNLDFAIFSDDATINRPLIIFEAVTIQHVQGKHTGRWASENSVFDLLNLSVNFPNKDISAHLDTIVADYSLETVWTDVPIKISAIDLLPSPEEIVKSNIDFTAEEDLIQSIEPLNKLAACYCQMALKHLELNLVDSHKQSLLTACHSLVSRFRIKTTFHSTRVRCMQLLDRFPRLQPLLNVLAECSLHLKQVLTGEKSGIEVLAANQEMEKGFQQIQSLLAANKTRLVFHAIEQHLRQKHNGEIKSSLNGHTLRMLWFASGDSSDALPVVRLLLDLSRETGLSIDLRYVELDPLLLEQAEQTFAVHLTEQNKLRITYDNRFDLSNVESTELIPVESYDIIFAPNRLQGIYDLAPSLILIRRLLISNGLILILELINVPSYFDLIFGLLDIWWSTSGDGRSLLDVEQWMRVMQEVGGFASVQVVPSEFGNSLIVAQKSTSCQILQTLDERQQQAWLLFADEHNQSIGEALKSFLPCVNVEFVHSSDSNPENIRFKLKQMMAKYQQLHIVFAWPLDQVSPVGDREKAFVQQEQLMCGTMLHIFQAIQMAQPRFYPFVFVLTRNAQSAVGSDSNPIGAPLVGLVRSLTIECERHRVKLIDLQSPVTIVDDLSFVRTLAQHLVACRYANNLDEIILRQDKKGDPVRRLEWHFEMLQKQQDDRDEHKSEQTHFIPCRDADQQPFCLQVASSRFLNDLVWVRDKPISELALGMIEVRVHCTGVNLRDILKVRGLYPHTRTFAQTDKDQPYLDRDTEPGMDCVGTVIRRASDVNIQLGDRVFVMSIRGTYHSHVIVDAREVARIPDECNHLTDEQLAAMPVACTTVLYSLTRRIQLQRRQTVLIHAATGGAGQACIQYCQYVGTRVLATASSEEKRRFLREQCGVEHVFNSRDLSFVNDVRAVLPGGVDIVVNSLSGSLLQESVKLLAPHGHFIEWGKRDVYDQTHLSMFNLRNDCSFHIICLDLFSYHRLDLLDELINESMQLIAKGVFKPFEPTLVYEPSQIVEAFQRMNSGQATGKCVIRLTSSKEPLQLSDTEEEHMKHENDGMFSSDVCKRGTILISGGFGGLGLTMSRWMVEEKDVKHIALMSRRTLAQLEKPDNPQYEDWLRLKRAANEHHAHVDVVQVDVTKFEEVHNLIDRFDQTPYPVRGIIHSAVVEDDRSLAKLTQDTLTRVLGPKVRGAWNLHQATQVLHTPVHFFILLSSIRTHLVDLASGGYSAGNQFLDALAHYRSKEFHLPALSVSLPAVSGAGMFHRYRDALTSLSKTQGFELMPTVAVFELVERFHVNQVRCPCPIIFACNWQILHRIGRKLATYQLVKIVEQRHNAMSHLLTSASSSSKVDGSGSVYNNIETIVERTQETVARLLGSTNISRITVDQSLISQGMDSLSAVSLYNWLGQEMGIYVPLADLLQGMSIQSIGKYIFGKRQEQQYNSSQSNRNEGELSGDDVKENEIEIPYSSYTGIEKVLCIQRPTNDNGSVVFCVTDQFTNDSTKSFSLFTERLTGKSNQVPSPTIYALRIPPRTSSNMTIDDFVLDMILQMRRIQPRGPYLLAAARGEQGETVAREMIGQLKKHSDAPSAKLLVFGEQDAVIGQSL